MKRSPLGPGRKALERGSTFASRGQGLKRTTASADPRSQVRQTRGKRPERVPLVAWCACGCGAMASDRHHVTYAQHVRAEQGDVDDARNLIALASDCHAAHHNRTAPLPLTSLPDVALDFARELFGDDAAGVYLTRRYAGTDPRLASPHRPVTPIR